MKAYLLPTAFLSFLLAVLPLLTLAVTQVTIG